MIDALVASLGAVTTEELLEAAVRIVGYAALAGGVSAIVSFVYRWYVRETIPEGIAVLLGVSAVAVWLNTRSALGDAILGGTELLAPATAIYTITAFVVGAIAADAGRRAGGSLAGSVLATSLGTRELADVNQLVRAAGRVVAVPLPETVEDVDGYDPVDPETKAQLEGTTLVFPRRLSPGELRDRIVSRLEHDYGIGHVDVELGEDRTIAYLAVGSRVAGLGPTLAPGTAAVAVQADPAFHAGPGDAVEVWTTESRGNPTGTDDSTAGGAVGDERTDVPDAGNGRPAPSDADGASTAAGTGEPTLVCSAELRAVAGDTVTLAVDEEDLDALDPSRAYRLTTLPATPGADRELASLLWAADETITSASVGQDGPLSDSLVGDLGATVVAIERDGKPIVTPGDDRALEAGDRLLILGRPDALRRVGTAGE